MFDNKLALLVLAVVLIGMVLFISPIFSGKKNVSVGELLLIDPKTDSPDDPGLEVFSTQEFFDKLPTMKARIRTIRQKFEADMPFVLRSIVGFENANFYIQMKDGSQKQFSLKLTDTIDSLSTLRLSEPSANICMDEAMFDKVLGERTPSDQAFAEGLADGKIIMEGFGFSAIKVRAITTLITFDPGFIISTGNCGPKGILAFEKVVPIGSNESLALTNSEGQPITAEFEITDPEQTKERIPSSDKGTATVKAAKLGWHDVKAYDSEVVLDFEKFIVVDLGVLNVFGASGWLLDSLNSLEALGSGLLLLLIVLTLSSGFVTQNRSQIFFEGKTKSSREENLARTYRTGLGAVAFVLPWATAFLVLGSAGIIVALVEMAIVLIAYTVTKRKKKAEELKAVHV
ncbi:MAG: hypothetical protein Q7K42_06165 [Candidatus Diapherotrites archaeon]|nr:hypothetical protein [Candidatus Diapherotrites archaeon]